MKHGMENQRKELAESRREVPKDAWADVSPDILSEPRFSKADDPAYAEAVNGSDLARQIAGKLAFGSLEPILAFARRKGVPEDVMRKIAEVDAHRKLARGSMPEEIMRRFSFDRREFLASAKHGVAYLLETGDVGQAKRLAEAFGLGREFLSHPRASASALRGIERVARRRGDKDDRLDLERLIDARDFLLENDPAAASAIPEGTRREMAALAVRGEKASDGKKTAWIAEHLGLSEDEMRDAALEEIERAYESGRKDEASTYIARFGIDSRAAEQKAIQAAARRYIENIDSGNRLVKELGFSEEMVREARRRAFAEVSAANPETGERFGKAVGLGSKERRAAALESVSSQVARGDVKNAELVVKKYGIKREDFLEIVKADLLRRFEAGETEKAVRLAEDSKIGQEVLKSQEIQDAIARSLMRRL